MDSPARRRVDELLDRVFPGDEPDETEDEVDAAPGDRPEPIPDGSDHGVAGVDERRQRLLEPLGDPDRESW